MIMVPFKRISSAFVAVVTEESKVFAARTYAVGFRADVFFGFGHWHPSQDIGASLAE